MNTRNPSARCSKSFSGLGTINALGSTNRSGPRFLPGGEGPIRSTWRILCGPAESRQSTNANVPVWDVRFWPAHSTIAEFLADLASGPRFAIDCKFDEWSVLHVLALLTHPLAVDNWFLLAGKPF